MLSSELREKITEFVESDMPMNELEEWLVPRLPWFMREPYSADSNVVAEVELGLAETNAGIQTIKEFRDNLKRVLGDQSWQFVLCFDDQPQRSKVQTGSSNPTDSQPLPTFVELAMAGSLL